MTTMLRGVILRAKPCAAVASGWPEAVLGNLNAKEFTV